ncbi:MAG: serine hydrolase [Vallitaleaceae bacterium]|jgi:CubicO group peptidase (beta-lactamase class C family)|nr:serine hydrolase [Vallitaleaceae bacterium]
MNIQKLSEAVISAEDFSGVIQINENGKKILHIASGFAKREDDIRNELDTKFGIASGTKLFTALGIMTLIEAGKLSLDEDALARLPYDFPNIKGRITVRQLLTHTSGIYDYFDEDVIENFTELFGKVPIHAINGPKDMLPLLVEGDSYFEPGERYKYCNSGYVILGILIEEISGMSYAAFIEKHLVKPLGLIGTGCYATNQLPKGTALGYEYDDSGAWYSNILSIPKTCTADGGLFTCTADIVRMWSALIGGHIVNEELTRAILSEQTIIDDQSAYGLGVYIQYTDNHTIKNYYLVGGDPGVSFYSGYYVENDIIITIIGNTTESAWELLDKIAEYID